MHYIILRYYEIKQSHSKRKDKCTRGFERSFPYFRGRGEIPLDTNHIYMAMFDRIFMRALWNHTYDTLNWNTTIATGKISKYTRGFERRQHKKINKTVSYRGLLFVLIRLVCIWKKLSDSSSCSSFCSQLAFLCQTGYACQNSQGKLSASLLWSKETTSERAALWPVSLSFHGLGALSMN